MVLEMYWAHPQKSKRPAQRIRINIIYEDAVMRLIEFANASDVMSLFKLITDTTWTVLQQQAAAQKRQLATNRKYKPKPKPKAAAKTKPAITRPAPRPQPIRQPAQQTVVKQLPKPFNTTQSVQRPVPTVKLPTVDQPTAPVQ